MPNQLDGSGLQIKTLDEIKSTIIAGLQAIYGDDINIDQNSPDGQLVNIFAQAALDNLELIQQIYTSFAVNQAFGTLLDQRVALNGLSRQPGSFTFTDVDITVDRALTLEGLDGDISNPDGTGFTVQDDAGNQFILAATQVIAAPGTYTYSFRAKAIGAVETTPNTITNQTTVTLGVTAVNNPTAAASVGDDEETDMALKTRHASSFNLAATGPADALEAALLALTDVTDALVVENDTAGPVGGIPAHSIWAIVEGGSDADIGQAIYSKKIPGCGQRGANSVTVTRPNGTTFIAKYDRPIAQNLYIRFTIVPKYAGITFDTDAVKASLVAALRYRLNQSANIGDVVVAMLTIAPDGILTTVGVSGNGTDWVDILSPTDFQHKFALDVARITVTV